ncbi:MAG TPA: ABC transporter ATP-binding protein [Chloroflexota bacterium]
MQALLRLAPYYKKYWLTALVALVAMLGLSGVELIVPRIIRYVIDCGIGVSMSSTSSQLKDCASGFDTNTIVVAAVVILLGLTVFKAVFQFLAGYLGEYGSQGIAYDLRYQIYEHLQSLSFAWHDRAQTGQLMSRATSDVEQLRNFTGRAMLQFANFLFTTVGTGILLLTTNWKLGLASMVAVPLLIRAGEQYARNVQPMWRQAQQEVAVLAAIVQENLAGAKVVKAFAQEPAQIEKFDQQNQQLLLQFLQASRVQAWANPLIDTIGNIGLVVVLWYGGYLIITGELSVGQLVAFNVYLVQLLRPVRRLGFLIGQGSRAAASCERVYEILDAPIEVKDSPDAVPLPSTTGHVVFDHVWCAYPGGEPVLRDVSFEASPGQVVALLGATGSGKTSVINLIPRFYDVTGGRVLIDDNDVRDVQLNSLRRQIGLVMQDTTLFTGTIRENISFGVPGAGDENIESAARAARAHDFIMDFPLGYDTLVGERGVTLSGGQKQRIAIARALLLDPRILILDDFTSAVDMETESLIREALNILMEGRTTFVIAQRVSTVVNADMIIVLDQGTIAGMGTHDELLETNEIYAEIYRLQLVDETVQQALGDEGVAALVGSEGYGGSRPWEGGNGSRGGHGPGRGGNVGVPGRWGR